MSISEYTVRHAIGRLLGSLERLQAASLRDSERIPGDDMAGYYRGCLFTREHDMLIIRRELADYLPEPAPCGCGNPAEGKDVTGAPICAHCMALTAQAIEELETS